MSKGDLAEETAKITQKYVDDAAAKVKEIGDAAEEAAKALKTTNPKAGADEIAKAGKAARIAAEESTDAAKASYKYLRMVLR